MSKRSEPKFILIEFYVGLVLLPPIFQKVIPWGMIQNLYELLPNLNMV